MLSVSLLTRGITDLGVALGAALALTLGAWRVAAGDMSVEALLIVLMAGTEIFRRCATCARCCTRACWASRPPPASTC